MDKNNHYFVTPAIRRRKRKPALMQEPKSFVMKVAGQWETFGSVAELVAFRAARGFAKS